MPKKEIDYSKTIIYKIVPKDLTLNLCYVGSTTNFVKRKYQHKSGCNNKNNKNYNFLIYQKIREANGWSAFDMIEVERYPATDFLDARKRERHWYEKLGGNMNTKYPERAAPEYYKDNKERITQYKVKYAELNKEKISNKGKVYYQEKKPQIQEYKKDYYQNNIDKVRSYKKEYYEKNRDKVKQAVNLHRQNNKEKNMMKVQCHICQKEISQKYLQTHMKVIHEKNEFLKNKQRERTLKDKDKRNERVVCSFCQKDLSKRCLKGHINRRHPQT